MMNINNKSKSKKDWLSILADLFALDEIKTLDLNAVELKKVVSVLKIVLEKMLDKYSVLDILPLSKPILRKFLKEFWGKDCKPEERDVLVNNAFELANDTFSFISSLEHSRRIWLKVENITHGRNFKCF